MKKYSVNFVIIIPAIVLLIVFILGFIMIKKSFNHPYNPNAIIGKTVSSIIEEYGPFDKVFYNEFCDKIGMGWYIINERKQTMLGVKIETYFVIQFENDVATQAYERVGNIGG